MSEKNLYCQNKPDKDDPNYICGYAYDGIFSGQLWHDDFKINEKGELEFSITCEGCHESTVFVCKVLERKLKK